MDMELFVQRTNVLFFRKQLAERPGLVRRLQLLRLLAEEEAKNYNNVASEADAPPSVPEPLR
jgi:hypothetical protein